MIGPLPNFPLNKLNLMFITVPTNEWQNKNELPIWGFGNSPIWFFFISVDSYGHFLFLKSSNCKWLKKVVYE